MPRLAPDAQLVFSHIGIFATDLESMEEFYTRAFGMVVTDRGDLPSGRLVFMSRDPAEHHQIVLCQGRPEDLQFTTINQISWRLPDLATLRVAHDILVELGAADIQPINHGISWSVYARDPEGNRLELFVDTPWYIPQPLREPLDLSLNDAELMKQSEARCVSADGYKPMEQWRQETMVKIRAAHSE